MYQFIDTLYEENVMHTQQSLGVVVGRFQVPELHAGHQHLIKTAFAHSDDVLIVVGVSNGFATARNPLPYPIREVMLRTAYPYAHVAPLRDHPSDESWSAALDTLIAERFPQHQVTLFGSRDSFLPYYSGTRKCQYVDEVLSCSGTLLRSALADESVATTDFRRGIIQAHVARMPVPYPVVDIAIVDHAGGAVLLGEKHHDLGRRCFVGGFVDTTDETLEQTALREVREETCLQVDNLAYLGSVRIDDWRYRNERDCILSTMFLASTFHGAPKASDDLAALHWTPLGELESILKDSHQPLAALLRKHLAQHK